MSEIKVHAEIVTLTDAKKSCVHYPNTVTEAVYDPDSNRNISDLLSEAAISVNTISDLDHIPLSLRANRKLVRVNDTGKGKPGYYSWDSYNCVWEIEKFMAQMDTVEEIPAVIKDSISWNNL